MNLSQEFFFYAQDQKLAFDDMVEVSISEVKDCVKAIIEESMTTIRVAQNLTTEAKVLAEELTQREAECGTDPSNIFSILKCLMEVLRLTKETVKLVIVKLKLAVCLSF